MKTLAAVEQTFAVVYPNVGEIRDWQEWNTECYCCKSGLKIATIRNIIYFAAYKVVLGKRSSTFFHFWFWSGSENISTLLEGAPKNQLNVQVWDSHLAKCVKQIMVLDKCLFAVEQTWLYFTNFKVLFPAELIDSCYLANIKSWKKYVERSICCHQSVKPLVISGEKINVQIWVYVCNPIHTNLWIDMRIIKSYRFD